MDRAQPKFEYLETKAMLKWAKEQDGRPRSSFAGGQPGEGNRLNPLQAWRCLAFTHPKQPTEDLTTKLRRNKTKIQKHHEDHGEEHAAGFGFPVGQG